MIRTMRTRFKKEILAEFIPPTRPTNKVVILCDGLPSLPAKVDVLGYFSRLGYWAFHIRYRGTWESGGLFLAKSPERDVIDTIDGMQKEFTEYWGGEKFRIPKPQVYVVGTSFGGCAAIMASRDRRVKKAVALSPVVDWQVQSRIEPIQKLAAFTAKAFGAVYRVERHDWDKLSTGLFFNPVAHEDEFDGRKLMIIHAKNDLIVPWKPTAGFAKRVGAKTIIARTGGHLRLAAAIKKPYARRIAVFLRT
jgi:pimeloyl-ACP methyl ester carboxylesterase